MIVDLSELSTSQLLELKKVITSGVVAKSEEENHLNEELIAVGQLCHKNPPKGYPKDKSEYGDPECYRYPLNTKSRCLAAWRYVNQEDNKKILGNKWSKVVAKIKSYAKDKYGLDLQSSESETFDWEEAFVEFYDSETVGERGNSNTIELEEEVKNMDEVIKEDTSALSNKITELSGDVEVKTKEIESKASEISSLVKELDELKKHNEDLVSYWFGKEIESEKVTLLKERKDKVEQAGLSDIDLEAETDKWLSMSNEQFDFIILMMKDATKSAKSSVEGDIKVPAVNSENLGLKEVVRQGFSDRKEKN